MPLLMLKDLPRYECLLGAAKTFPDLDPSACEVFLHLLRAGDEAFALAEKNFHAHGISHGRFGVLMLLFNSGKRSTDPVGGECFPPGPRTPAELAEAAGVTRATMTGLIDTLERDGFVTRESDPHDRRMMSVRLTPKAEQFLHGMLPGHFQLMASLVRPLAESERHTLVRLLNKMISHAAMLREAPADPGSV
jgi:DNA-binding MarR family transcriptional regulator